MKLHRPALAIDLDDVLIKNSGGLKVDMFQAVRSQDAPRARARAAYADLRTKQFSFKAFARAVFRDARRRRGMRRALNALLTPARRYNYPGAEKFLTAARRRYRVLLVSYGARAFQRAKLAQSRLARCFSEIIVTKDASKRGALVRLKKKYGDMLLVLDDALAVAREARMLGIRVIRVRKGLKNAAYYAHLMERIARLFAR